MSLIAPLDRKESKISFQPAAASLSTIETKDAVEELAEKSYITKFPQLERTYADPIDTTTNQRYCLHSFMPAKGATPDKDGIYGMVKFRGAYQTEQEADARTEFLIRNVDSYHSIYMGYVGRPFPLSQNKKYIPDTKEIDIKKKAIEVISEDIKKTRTEEKKQIEEIAEKQKELLEEPSPEQKTYDEYITLKVKRAQLIWTYEETQKKLVEMKNVICKTEKELHDMDEKFPEYHKDYYNQYMEARKKSGLSTDDDSFIKYLNLDVDLKKLFCSCK